MQEGYTQCPECGDEIKETNAARHYRRRHPGVTPPGARETQRGSMLILVGIGLGIVLIIGGILAATWYLSTTEGSVDDGPTFTAGKAIHWHPQLSITVYGQPLTIPPMDPTAEQHGTTIHTHDASGTLHVEGSFQSQPTLQDFFNFWATKDSTAAFTRDQINGNFVSDTATLEFLVNGETNLEYQYYRLWDGDRISIIYG